MMILFPFMLIAYFILSFVLWIFLLIWGIVLWSEKEKIGFGMSVIYGFWGICWVNFIFNRYFHYSQIILIEKMLLIFFPFFMWIPLFIFGILMFRFRSRKKDSVKMVVLSLLSGLKTQ